MGRRIFDRYWSPKWSILTSFWQPFWKPFSDIASGSAFGFILVVLWLPLGSLWLPFGALWAHYGSLWLSLGSLWLSFACFGRPFGSNWFHFGDLWSPLLPSAINFLTFDGPWLHFCSFSCKLFEKYIKLFTFSNFVRASYCLRGRVSRKRRRSAAPVSQSGAEGVSNLHSDLRRLRNTQPRKQ